MTGKRLPLNTTGTPSAFHLAQPLNWKAPPPNWPAPEPSPTPAPAAAPKKAAAPAAPPAEPKAAPAPRANKVPAPAAGKPASRYNGPINPAAVKVHSGIPLPTGRTNRGSVSDALLKRMKPGQVVFLPKSNATSLIAYAKRLKIKVAARQMHKDPLAVAEAGPDAMGVWRLE